MGLDLIINIVNGDEADFEELKRDTESWWDHNELYKSAIEVSSISYRRAIVSGLLNFHFNKGDGVQATRDEYLTQLKTFLLDPEPNIDKEFGLTEEELNEIIVNLKELIEKIETIDVSFSNAYIFTISS